MRSRPTVREDLSARVSELRGVWIPKSESHRCRSLNLGGAAVEAAFRGMLVVVHVLFVLVEPLALGCHLGDAPSHHLQLAHRRVLLSV